MKKYFTRVKITSILIFLCLAHWGFSQKIQYEISCPNAVHHEANINVIASDIPLTPATFRMSRSSPGRYATHEFGKNVYDVKAFDISGNALKVNRIEGDVYQVNEHKGYIKLSYKLYGRHADGTYASIDATGWHFNMPATFLWLKGFENTPIEVYFNLPKDKNWKIATQLKPSATPSVFTAPNLQYLMDCPTKVGDLHIREWSVKNTDNKSYTFRLAIEASTSDSLINVLTQKVQRIVQEAKSVFGEFPNYDFGTYTFIASINPYVQGDGMEHRNSTMITIPAETIETNEWALDVFAHEFFHCWNVERIRPKTLEPFNFEKSNMSNELWFAEGFTQYYGQLLMARSGIMADSTYAQVLDNAVYAKNNTRGCIDYSPIDASRHAVFVDAGIAVDKNNYSNMFTSYYGYGAAIALALDLELRTEFKTSLDSYMQAVWQRFGKSEMPYTIQDLENTLGIHIKNSAFASTFFKKYIYGHEAIDFQRLFASAGYTIKKDKKNKAWLGGRFQNTDKGVTVAENTIVGTPIYEAGIDVDDIITHINEKPIAKQEDLHALIESLQPNEPVSITFKHRGVENKTVAKLIENPYFTVYPYENEGLPLTPDIINFRKNWLGSKLGP